MFAVVGILAGVLKARASGKGEVVDIAMTDGSAVLTSLFHAFSASGLWRDQRGGNLLDGSKPFYRCYVCSDGRHVAVGSLEPQFFAQLLIGLDIAPDRFSQFDPSGWPAMQAAFEAVFATRTRDEWVSVFEGTDACVSPVLSFGEAPSHAQNQERNTFVTVDGVAQPAPAPRFSQSPTAVAPDRRGLMTIDEAIAAWRT